MKKPFRLRTALSWLIFAGLMLAMPALLRADLDCIVYIPPGSPLDWSQWRPGNSTPMRDAVLSGMESPKPKPEENTPEPDGDATGVVDMDPIIESVPEANSYGITLDPWTLSGVTTADIPAHVPFWNAVPENPPAISSAFRFAILGRFVQMLLYPEDWDTKAPAHELVCYFIEVGEPFYFAANAVKVMGSGEAAMTPTMNRVVKEVLEQVGAPAAAMPTPLQGATPFDDFMNRLVCEELSEGSPYDYDPTFGEHILNHAEIVLPYLVNNALNHPSLLVQRNATYMLRYFPDEAATKALRTKLAGKDPVSRNRALSTLLKRNDKTIVPFLLESLKNNPDFYFQSMAVYALGGLGFGNQEVESAILDWVEPALNMDKTVGGEYVYSAAAALARLGASSKPTLKFYEKAEKRYSMKAHYVGQALLLAKAAAGLKAGLEDLHQFAHEKVSKFLNCNLGLALNVYNFIGARLKRDFLTDMINDKALDTMLRYYAIKTRPYLRTELSDLKKIATDETYPNILRSVAMLKLWEFDMGTAKGQALKVIDTFLKDNNIKGSRSESYDAVIALQMLGPSKSLTYQELARILEHALKIEKQAKDKSDEDDLDSKMKFIPAPVFRYAAMEMGRLGTRNAAGDLIKILLDKSMPGRYEAARALAFCPFPETVDALLVAMQDDKYGWVRWYAAQSLAVILETELFCDWQQGDAAKRAEVLEFWTAKAEAWKAAFAASHQNDQPGGGEH